MLVKTPTILSIPHSVSSIVIRHLAQNLLSLIDHEARHDPENRFEEK